MLAYSCGETFKTSKEVSMKSDFGGPVDQTTEQRVRDSFALQGLMVHLGAVLHEVRQGLVVIRMPFKPELTQHHGFFHAGALSAIADTAGGYAGLTLFPEGSSVLTVEFKLNLLNPAQGGYVEAVGRVVKGGRTLTICQLEVFSSTDEKRVQVALGQQTLICLPDRSRAS
jgi:uncharacterized protein (TIGR00369 family)